MCKLPTGIRRHKSGGYIVDLTRNGRRQTRVFHTLKQAVSARLEMAEQAEQEPSSRRGGLYRRLCDRHRHCTGMAMAENGWL